MSRQNLRNLATMVALGASVAGGEEIRSYSNNPLWIANGEPKRIWVEGSNEDTGNATAGATWQLNAPGNFLPTGNYGLPDPGNDFFGGETQWYQYNDIGQVSERANFTPPFPENTTGDLFFYDVNISSTSPFGETNFYFVPGNTFFTRPDATAITPVMTNEPVMVVPTLDAMAANMTGPSPNQTPDQRFDRDGDQDMDLGDLAQFQQMYSFQGQSE